MKRLLTISCLLIAMTIITSGCKSEKKEDPPKKTNNETSVTSNTTDNADAPREKVQYYTCTMHPEVKETQPGNCPKCGMKLVPMSTETIMEETTELASTMQMTCPIMDGNKIDKSIFVDYEGKRIYFCCPGCESKFNEDPDLYVKKLEDMGVKLESTPTTEN